PPVTRKFMLGHRHGSSLAPPKVKQGPKDENPAHPLSTRGKRGLVLGAGQNHENFSGTKILSFDLRVNGTVGLPRITSSRFKLKCSVFPLSFSRMMMIFFKLDLPCSMPASITASSGVSTRSEISLPGLSTAPVT